MSKESIPLYCFTTAGLEEVTAEEVGQRLADSRVEEARRGVVFFTYGGKPEPLLELSTTEDVFALIARGEVSGARQGLAQAGELVLQSPFLEGAGEL